VSRVHRRRPAAALLSLPLALALLGGGPGTAAAACPNEALRIEDDSTTLPDCRAYELVSPLEKNGGQLQGPGQLFGGGVLQGAAGGEAITYSSSASFGEGAQGAPPASQYIARRSAAGWATENITTPLLSGSYGDHPNGVPYQLFSPDLAHGLLLNGRRCGEGEECPRSYSLRDDESGVLAPSPEEPDLRFAGASPDLDHVVLSTCAKLTAEATEVPSGGGGCEAADPNLYEWEAGQLRLVNLLPGETEGTPGATLAAQGLAVSTNGNRVYFTQGGDLYLREGAQTRQVDESVGGGGSFQTASADGSVAFFTKAGHLYRYEAAGPMAADLTPSGEVQGVLGASESGAYLYYETAAGLDQWHEGTTTQLHSGPAAEADDYPPATGTARVSPDGAHLAFLSKASLTGYANGGDSEVYLYGPPPLGGASTLACVSCNPSGKAPLGPSTIPGAIPNGAAPGSTDSYKPRDLSADGSRLFFDSEDSLVATDSNKRPDAYEWEAKGAGACQKAAGCISLISGGQSGEGSEFIDASAKGSDVFFLTAESLLPQDPGSADLYDAREGGGYPQAHGAIECDGDACQSLPAEPEDPTPGTLVPGEGNPPAHFPREHHKKKHHKKRRHGSRKRGRR